MKSLYFLVIFYPLSIHAVFTEYSQLKLDDSTIHLYAGRHCEDDNVITNAQMSAENQQLNGLKEGLKRTDKKIHFLVEEPFKEVTYCEYVSFFSRVRPEIKDNKGSITGENGECRLYTLAYHAKYKYDQKGSEYQHPLTRTLQTQDEERVASIVDVTIKDVLNEVQGAVDTATNLARTSGKPYRDILETQISLTQKDVTSFPENMGLIASLLDLHLLRRTIELIQKGYDVAICAGQTHTSNIRGLLRRYNFPSSKQITGKPYLTAEDMKASISDPEDLACNSFCTIS